MSGIVGLESVIGCPECRSPFDMRPDVYTCHGKKESDSVAVFDRRDGVPNLLPRFIGSDKYKGSVGDVSFEYGGSTVSLPAKTVGCFLNDITGTRMREVDEHIGDVVNGFSVGEGVYLPDGRLTTKGVQLVTGLFQEVLSKYRGRVSSSALPNLAAAVSKARYEAELASSRDYVGNFVLPDDFLGVLPSRADVLVEFAVGNGANLRKLTSVGDYGLSLGFDNCSGMVRAADARNANGSFLAVGDALHPPLQRGSVDMLFMFNALDRIASPHTALRKLADSVRPGGTVVLGNCVPLQYAIEGAGFSLEYVPVGERFESVADAVRFMGADVVDTGSMGRGLEWHPETVLQGREDLVVDVVLGRMP